MCRLPLKGFYALMKVFYREGKMMGGGVGIDSSKNLESGSIILLVIENEGVLNSGVVGQWRQDSRNVSRAVRQGRCWGIYLGKNLQGPIGLAQGIQETSVVIMYE